MIKLSVVIVNYNVKYFLEQCLLSVCKSVDKAGFNVEVLVVDNNSVDGSVKMLKEKFHEITLIENKENKGFSRGNNDAIKLAKGQYVLLLNPDTIVEDDTFLKIVNFMDEHPEAGGLGVKMIDGKGRFLPESKRALPTPKVAFFKVFGLSGLFPKSKVFGRYHLGYLDKEEVNEVEVLSGAFMMLRKEVLEKIGLLDESFFMYGEDIDLSYRIIKAGYKNYYYPHTRIIHYKGESTKKSSINYVLVFYNAMILFAQKHFSVKNAKTFTFLIRLAIYFRASLSLLRRFIDKALLVLLDVSAISIGMVLLKKYWESHVTYTGGGEYPEIFTFIVLPAYIAIWLFTVFVNGGYDFPVRFRKLLSGIVIGTCVILVSYALLSETYRFSRALILLGTVWACFSLSFIRLILHFSGMSKYKLSGRKGKRFVVVGEIDELERVAGLLQKVNVSHGFLGYVTISDTKIKNDTCIGSLNQLEEIIDIHRINEIIFCAKNISSHDIMEYMARLQKFDLDYKIVPPEGMFIIGSNSINAVDDLFSVDLNSIVKPSNKRNKRFFDLIISLFLLLFYPLLFLFVKQSFGLLRNIFLVLFSAKSWVGYANKQKDSSSLPDLKIGVLDTSSVINNSETLSDEMASRLNLMYARDYRVFNDINIMWRGFKFLGR